jgi:hypothetical protein
MVHKAAKIRSNVTVAGAVGRTCTDGSGFRTDGQNNVPGAIARSGSELADLRTQLTNPCNLHSVSDR